MSNLANLLPKNEATSDRWFEAWVDSLQDPEEAIACLEVLLEETEDDPTVRDRAFVRAMTAVTEGQIAAGRCSDSARETLQRFEQVLLTPGSGIIYAWLAWLRAIGLGLVIRQEEGQT